MVNHLPASSGDAGLIPGSGRSTGGGILAWAVPWAEEPDRLQSMGLQKNWTRLSDRASLIAQLVKNAPAIQETRVRFLGWEDLLEEGKTTHSSILA